MKVKGNPAEKNRPKIKIEEPSIQSPEDEKLWQELRKYARLVPFEPDPNLGRVKEIIEEIKKGTYPKPEVIEKTAERLAVRFMKKE